MVGVREHFGITKPPDAGVLVAVVGDVDDEPRGAGADVGVRRLDAAAPIIVFQESWRIGGCEVSRLPSSPCSQLH